MKSVLFICALFCSVTALGQVDLLNENFDSGFPMGWTVADEDGNTLQSQVSQFTNAWIIQSDQDTMGMDSVAASTSYYNPEGQSYDMLITPQLTLGAYGNYLYWEGMSHDPSYPDSYIVLYSTTDAQPASFQDTLIVINNEPPSWTSYDLSLDTAGITGQTVYLAFVNVSDDKYILYLDNIRVQIEDPVSAEEHALQTFRAYPTPCTDQIFMDLPTGTQYRIYDITGRLELQGSYNGSVEMTSLPGGTYVLEVGGYSRLIQKQ